MYITAGRAAARRRARASFAASNAFFATLFAVRLTFFAPLELGREHPQAAQRDQEPGPGRGISATPRAMVPPPTTPTPVR